MKQQQKCNPLTNSTVNETTSKAVVCEDQELIIENLLTSSIHCMNRKIIPIILSMNTPKVGCATSSYLGFCLDVNCTTSDDLICCSVPIKLEVFSNS